MKRLFSLILVVVLCFLSLSFVACGCEHENTTFIEDTATCENDGVKRYKCVNCGEIIEKSSPKTGHDYSVFVSDSATCTSNGYKTYKCSRCSSTTKSASTKLGHSYKGCKCSRCGEIKSDYEKVTINYSSGKVKYSKQFTQTYGSGWAILSVTFNQDSKNVSIMGGGDNLYSIVNFDVYAYDNNNVLLFSKSFGYIPSRGSIFAETKTAEMTHTLSNGDICYIYLKVTLI